MKKYWEEPVCGIYRISHRDSDKSYIGQSRDVFKRWKEHSNFSKKKLSCISSALKLYSLQSFVWEVIEECSLEELNSREVYWISYFNSMSPNGYNLTSGGGQGTIISKRTKAKISKIHKGKTLSEETRAKISESHKGKTASEETRAKLSESQKARHKARHKARYKARPKVTCPHCSKKGQKPIMVRWHFDNCKLKPQSLLESETSSTSAKQSHNSDQQTSDT